MSSIKQLTDDQLIAKAREYDRGINEGGDGYNPYTSEMDRRATEREAARPRTRMERRDSLLRELERLDCSIARESGTYDADQVAAIRSEIDAIDAAEDAEFLKAWPLELTMARRAEWNAMVKNKYPKGITYQELAALEKAQGWTLSDAKRAKKLHNIQ